MCINNVRKLIGFWQLKIKQNSSYKQKKYLQCFITNLSKRIFSFEINYSSDNYNKGLNIYDLSALEKIIWTSKNFPKFEIRTLLYWIYYLTVPEMLQG